MGIMNLIVSQLAQASGADHNQVKIPTAKQALSHPEMAVRTPILQLRVKTVRLVVINSEK